MGIEVELKLTLGPKQLARLRKAPVLATYAAGEPEQKRLVSTYYDTPEHTLTARGVALRVRRIGDRFVQTVKRKGVQHYERGEWETDLPGDALDPAAVPEPDLRDLLTELHDQLGPVFVTDFERETRRLKLPSGTEVEVAFDRGEIRAGDATEPIHEVELELLTGDTGDLFTVARRLHRVAMFRLETRSKAARGYALHAPKEPRSLKAKAPDLQPDLTVEDAFKRIAHTCLTHMRGNELCVMHGVDIGGVHQMRVAARRLRSAISLFRKVLPRRRARRVQLGLRWIAKELADARQWDVFINETLARVRDQLAEDDALQGLADAADAARRLAYARAHRAVESRRYTRVLLDLGRWLEARDWASHEGEDALHQPVGELAVRILEKRSYKVRCAAREFEHMKPEELHRLRIEVKKLRYATHFLRGLFPGKRADEFAGVAGDLQDILGHIQDVADTPVFLGALPEADAPALTRAIGVVAGWQAAAEVAARRALPHVWQRFVGLDRFWTV